MRIYRSILLISLSAIGVATLKYSYGRLQQAVIVPQVLLAQSLFRESPPSGCDRTDPPGCHPRQSQSVRAI
ncbi:MAG TPA: hypothetical protein DDZ80_10885 [Cyanobacteria bacterium UBA8803]|nr:hypothetical protein [Cyanobacteria bacterium UBA8803]